MAQNPDYSEFLKEKGLDTSVICCGQGGDAFDGCHRRGRGGNRVSNRIGVQESEIRSLRAQRSLREQSGGTPPGGRTSRAEHAKHAEVRLGKV